MLTGPNTTPMPSATMTVRSGGLFWPKPAAMVLFMVCSAVPAEWLLLKPCRMEMCVMLPVMHGSSVFSSASAITERSEMGLHDVPMLMSPFGFEIGMRSASSHS